MLLLALCSCLAACGGAAEDPVLGQAGLAGQGFALIRTPAQFRAQVAGQTLSGARFRARVADNGALSGAYRGRRFDGRWTFRDGRFCQSLTADMNAPGSGCYYIAARGDELRLIPVDDSG